MQTVEVTVPLHPAQDLFCRSEALYRGFVGGRGAGKSWVGAFDLICRAREGRTYLVGSPTGVLMQDTTYPTFKAIAQGLGVWWSVKLTPYPNVTIAPGAVVRFRTAEDPDRMRGPNLSGVWLDEASLMHEDAYKVCIACLREAGEQGWLSATFTPKGLEHWTYDVFGRTPPRPNVAIFHAATRENPFVPVAFHATVAGQYGGLLAEQELEGKFLAVEGAEWPPAYFGDHLWFDDWPTDLQVRAVGLDPSKGKDARSGDYAAFVLGGRDPEVTLWLDADLRKGQSAEAVAENAVEIQRTFNADVFGVEANQFQQLFSVLIAQAARRHGVFMPLAQLVNTVPKDVRIRRFGQYLRNRQVRVRNTPGGRLLVEQWRSFPQGRHDDGPDAAEMMLRVMIDLWNGRVQARQRR